MVLIDGKYLNDIEEHAGGALSHEVCGILAGCEGKVEKIFRMSNVSETPEQCYLMDPREQLKVMKEIRNSGLEMIGIYHSHPGSEPYPSAKDVELAYYPDAVYLIVSLKIGAEPEIRAYRIIDGKISEEEVRDEA